MGEFSMGFPPERLKQAEEDRPVTACGVVCGAVLWTAAGAAITYVGLTALIWGGYGWMSLVAYGMNRMQYDQ